MAISKYFASEYLDVARGISINATPVNIFGYNSSVGKTDFVPLWEDATAYTYPTEGLLLTIASTDPADNGGVVTVVGLDENYEVISEQVTIPGTTNLEFFRINSFLVTGGIQSNAGVITAVNTGVTYAKIRAGDGKNQAAIYTVPAGHDLYLYRIDAFSATALSNKYVFFRNFVSNDVTYRVAETSFVGQMNIMRVVPFKYEEHTDIQFQSKSSDQTNEVGVFGEGI